MTSFLIVIAIVFGGLGIGLAGKHIELIITKRWRGRAEMKIPSDKEINKHMNQAQKWAEKELLKGWNELKHKTITLSGLTELQCAKWFFLHERQRHVDDIVGIDKDLEKLKDICLPTDVIQVLGARFEIPEKFQ